MLHLLTYALHLWHVDISSWGGVPFKLLTWPWILTSKTINVILVKNTCSGHDFYELYLVKNTYYTSFIQPYNNIYTHYDISTYSIHTEYIMDIYFSKIVLKRYSFYWSYHITTPQMYLITWMLLVKLYKILK